MTNLARGPRSTPDTPPTEDEQRSALSRLITIVALGLLIAVLTHTLKTVAVVAALIGCIFLHELGHYITAKWGHMKVTEFFIGFGPRLWSMRKGETEYGVKGIPAGAYVKVIGMNNLDPIEDPADEPRTYRAQSYPRRLAVGLAGSFMHFLVAILLLIVLNGAVGKPHDTLQIGEISKLETGPSPAQEAGFKLNDRIVKIDGQPVARWNDLRDRIRAKPDQDIVFTVVRGGQQLDLTTHTVDLHQVKVQGIPATQDPVGFVGIGPKLVLVRANPAAAVVDGAKDFGTTIGATFGALGKIFSPSGIRDYLHTLSGTSKNPDTRFLSPVGFVRLASESANTGLFEVLELLILINIFVGVFNLVPLPPLDGGHVAVATYEAIRSKLSRRRYQVDAAKLLPVTYAVFLILVFIGLTSLYLDLVSPSPNPFK